MTRTETAAQSERREVTCRVCKQPFEAKPYQTRKYAYRCAICRRAYEVEWRKRRKAEGRPVRTAQMSREWLAEYRAEYNKTPEVRQRLARLNKERMKDPQERMKAKARRRARYAVDTGRMERQPCQVCGEPRSQAHHEDYSRPLDVEWLCPVHHTERHAKANTETETGNG